MTNLIKQEWYQHFLEQSKSAHIVLQKEGALKLMQARWEIGKLIVDNQDNFNRAEIYGEKLIKKLAEDYRKMNLKGLGERTLYRCINFYEATKEVDFDTAVKKLPSEIDTFNKVLTKLLPPPKDECSHSVKTRQITEYYCELCGKSWRTNPNENKLEGFTQRDYLVKYLMAKHKLSKLDKTIAENKDYARRCITKFGYEETKKMIEISANSDNFWNNKITSMVDIYRNGIKIGQSEIKKPYYKNYLMKQLADGRWRVQVEGEWKDFAGKKSEIEWK